MADLSILLQQFPDIHPGKDPGHYEGTCPACRKKKKLRLTVGRNRAWVKCWSNCDASSILAAIGQSEDFLKFPSEPAPINLPRRPATAPVPPVRLLAARHREELEASGISEQIIEDMGCWTCDDPEELRKLGFSTWQSKAVPCLVFPSFRPDGSALYQVKPDRPFRGEDGKPIKYMTPAGARCGVGVLPAIAADIVDSTRPLWVTEGLKKAGSAISRGLACISLSGVWNWQRKDPETGEHIPLPDWDEIPLQRRTVYIAFDSDAVRKEAVHAALRSLLAFLSSRGAIIRIVYLPDASEGEKTGLDDYFAAGRDVNDVLDLADDTLRPLAPEFGQEFIKAVNKRAKGAAVFTTISATFANETEKALASAVYARLAITGQARDADFWIGGESWLQARKIYKRGELWDRYSAKFGPAIAKKDADAARICKKFPLEVRRANVRPWVYEEIENTDADTQRLILDTYEGEGLTRAEVRQFLNPGGVPGGRRATKDEPTSTLSHDMAAMQELIPPEDRRDFVKVVTGLGWEKFHDLLQQQKQLLEAREADEIYRAHFGTQNRENERFEIVNLSPAKGNANFSTPESPSNSPSLYEEQGEGKTLHTKTESRGEEPPYVPAAQSPANALHAKFSQDAWKAAETGSLPDDPEQLRPFAPLLEEAPDEDTRIFGGPTEVKLLRFARWHAAQYRKTGDMAHIEALQAAETAWKPPDRLQLARQACPELVAAVYAGTIPEIPCSIPLPDGTRWEGTSLNFTALYTLDDFVTLAEFQEAEATARLHAVDKVIREAAGRGLSP